MGLETQPDHETVLVGRVPRHRCGPGGHGTLLQRDMEIDHALVAGGLGAEHTVKPGVLMRTYAHCRRMGEDTERIVANSEIQLNVFQQLSTPLLPKQINRFVEPW